MLKYVIVLTDIAKLTTIEVSVKLFSIFVCMPCRSHRVFLSSFGIAALCCAWCGAVDTSQCIGAAVAYSGMLFGVGSTNSVEDRGQRERGSGGGTPLVRGSAQFANE
jgi:hypothetical protein